MKIYRLEFLLKILEIKDKDQLIRILEKKEEAYHIFEIPKKNGMRQIHGLDGAGGRRLKRLQQRFYRKVLLNQPAALPAKGFLKGESYQTFLEPHVGSRYYLRLDIHDFFGSFSEGMIRENLSRFIEDEEAADFAFELCTVEGRMPQGAVTSPALSNIVFARLDQRIVKYCQALEAQQRKRQSLERENWQNASIRYTRYADDMLFGSDFFDFRENLSFLHMISRILGEYGFSLNRKKTIMTEWEISLNGYVVGSDIRLSRKKTSELRRILYCCKDKGAQRYRLNKALMENPGNLLKEINRFSSGGAESKKAFSDIHQLVWYLGGCRAWLISVLQVEENTGKEVHNMKKLVRRTECLLEALKEVEYKSY
ncbi:MAG: RNA-directed DNA polymerase [Dorea sp.]|nr:RNA-directed DNA polymerase [Dorea sp.]